MSPSNPTRYPKERTDRFSVCQNAGLSVGLHIALFTLFGLTFGALPEVSLSVIEIQIVEATLHTPKSGTQENSAIPDNQAAHATPPEAAHTPDAKAARDTLLSTSQLPPGPVVSSGAKQTLSKPLLRLRYPDTIAPTEPQVETKARTDLPTRRHVTTRPGPVIPKPRVKPLPPSRDNKTAQHPNGRHVSKPGDRADFSEDRNTDAAPVSADPTTATGALATPNSTRRPEASTTSFGHVTPPRIHQDGTANPKPRYPYVARRLGQEGQTRLLVHVDLSGTVHRIDVSSSSGFRLLDEAAIEAVRKWRFLPAHIGNVDVAGMAEVPVTFQLTN